MDLLKTRIADYVVYNLKTRFCNYIVTICRSSETKT